MRLSTHSCGTLRQIYSPASVGGLFVVHAVANHAPGQHALLQAAAPSRVGSTVERLNFQHAVGQL